MGINCTYKRHKNQLYVNLSETDEMQFNLSKEDKVLNKAFYG